MDDVTPAEIERGIDSLKQMCDPRGHDLLDVIGQALITQAESVERLDEMLDMLAGREWVEGRRSLPVVEPPVQVDNGDHSKQAHLRSVPNVVSGGRCV